MIGFFDNDISSFAVAGKLDDCSYYEMKNINSIPIYIFESHNMALPVWGAFSTIYGPMNLISFDSHTDTHPAFSRYLRKLGKCSDFDYKRIMQEPEVEQLLSNMKYKLEDYSFIDVFNYSLNIFNTEQILTGVAFGYLTSYIIRSHRCNGFEESDRGYGYDATYINDEDTRIPIIRSPLALDIDLDYFRKEDELGKHFREYISRYVRAAKVITIARESRFFESGKSSPTFSIETAEKILLDIMNDVTRF